MLYFLDLCLQFALIKCNSVCVSRKRCSCTFAQVLAKVQATTQSCITLPPKLASLLSRVTGTFLSLALSLSWRKQNSKIKCVWMLVSTSVCVCLPLRTKSGEQELPSVCVVWSHLSCSVLLSRCLRPSALQLWWGPDGTIWAVWPDPDSITVPTNACSDCGCRDGDAQRNVCNTKSNSDYL